VVIHASIYRNILCATRHSDVLSFEAKLCSPALRGSPRTRELYRGTPCQKRQFYQYAAIIRKRCETGYKPVLFTNRKSHTDFRSVPKSVTLSDLERLNDRRYASFHTIRQAAFGAKRVEFTAARPTLSATRM